MCNMIQWGVHKQWEKQKEQESHCYWRVDVVAAVLEAATTSFFTRGTCQSFFSPLNAHSADFQLNTADCHLNAHSADFSNKLKQAYDIYLKIIMISRKKGVI
jgi:hypothetical protein